MISSIVSFILGFLYSYYFYKASKKKYELSLFMDQKVKDTSTDAFYFYIWNSGNETIYKTDSLDNPPSINVFPKENFNIQYAHVDQVSSDYLRVDLKKFEFGPLNINFNLLRPDEGFCIIIKVGYTPEMTWDFNIKQQKNIMNFPKAVRKKGFTSNLDLISNYLSVIPIPLMAVNLFFVSNIDFTNLSSSSGYIGIVNLLFAIISLGAIPLVIKRTLAPRPPRELKIYSIEEKKHKK